MAKKSFGKWQLADLPLEFFASSSFKSPESPSAPMGTAAQECPSALGRRHGKTFVGLEGTGQGDNEGNARRRWPVQWKETGNQQVGKPGKKDPAANWEWLGREKPETGR